MEEKWSASAPIDPSGTYTDFNNPAILSDLVVVSTLIHLEKNYYYTKILG
ncbi:hypothetical protein [Lactococcus cremoris]|nr:hypothetical protein [Lactococcus cremoris]